MVYRFRRKSHFLLFPSEFLSIQRFRSALFCRWHATLTCRHGERDPRWRPKSYTTSGEGTTSSYNDHNTSERKIQVTESMNGHKILFNRLKYKSRETFHIWCEKILQCVQLNLGFSHWPKVSHDIGDNIGINGPFGADQSFDTKYSYSRFREFKSEHGYQQTTESRKC